MAKHKVTIEVVENRGKPCRYHPIGHKMEYPEDRGELCPAAFTCIFPGIRMMESGGHYHWFDEPDAHLWCCNDPKSPIVFKVSRRTIEN